MKRGHYFRKKCNFKVGPKLVRLELKHVLIIHIVKVKINISFFIFFHSFQTVIFILPLRKHQNQIRNNSKKYMKITVFA